MSGYVDLQVNGYAGVDFNADDYSDEAVRSVCNRMLADGTQIALATVITASLDKMVARVSRIASLIDSDPIVHDRIGGIHVEGPFLNPAEGYIGAHPTSASIPADCDIAMRLLDAGRGYIKLWTLAPERDPGALVTSFLTQQKVVVAAGHCDSTIDQLKEGIDHGLRLFTHLGNGCPGLLPRHDNIVQRVLSLSDRILISFIADGHHVPPFALKNYLSLIPNENIVIVTDAISAAGLGPGKYELSGQTVEVDEDGAAWASCRTHYAGCATTFPRMVDVLREHVSATDEQIEAWLQHNPARLLGLS